MELLIIHNIIYEYIRKLPCKIIQQKLVFIVDNKIKNAREVDDCRLVNGCDKVVD